MLSFAFPRRNYASGGVVTPHRARSREGGEPGTRAADGRRERRLAGGPGRVDQIAHRVADAIDAVGDARPRPSRPAARRRRSGRRRSPRSPGRNRCRAPPAARPRGRRRAGCSPSPPPSGTAGPARSPGAGPRPSRRGEDVAGVRQGRRRVRAAPPRSRRRRSRRATGSASLIHSRAPSAASRPATAAPTLPTPCTTTRAPAQRRRARLSLPRRPDRRHDPAGGERRGVAVPAAARLRRARARRACAAGARPCRRPSCRRPRPCGTRRRTGRSPRRRRARGPASAAGAGSPAITALPPPTGSPAAAAFSVIALREPQRVDRRRRRRSRRGENRVPPTAGPSAVECIADDDAQPRCRGRPRGPPARRARPPRRRSPGSPRPRQQLGQPRVGRVLLGIPDLAEAGDGLGQAQRLLGGGARRGARRRRRPTTSSSYQSRKARSRRCQDGSSRRRNRARRIRRSCQSRVSMSHST